MEWLPQENIIFDGANAEICTKIVLAAGATYLGWEISCLGRTASGEHYSRGILRQVTEICLEDKLLWSERGVVQGGDRLLDSPIGLAGRPVVATFIAAGKNTDQELLRACRELKVDEARGDRCGITPLPNLFIARYLGHSTGRARLYFESLWALARPFFVGSSACPPRIWKT